MPQDDDQDAINKLADSLRQSGLMDSQAAYLARGRALAGKPPEEVQQVWASAFRAWAANRMEAAQLAMDDAMAELAIRGMQPDLTVVVAEWAKVQDIIRSDYENILEDEDLRDHLERRIAEHKKRSGPGAN